MRIQALWRKYRRTIFKWADYVLSSQDSRYWGLLPEEYIVGKATRIFRSVDKHTGKERWKRFLKEIE